MAKDIRLSAQDLEEVTLSMRLTRNDWLDLLVMLIKMDVRKPGVIKLMTEIREVAIPNLNVQKKKNLVVKKKM